MRLRACFAGSVPAPYLDLLTGRYDVVGDVAVLSFHRLLQAYEAEFARAAIAHRKNIRKVLNRVSYHGSVESGMGRKYASDIPHEIHFIGKPWSHSSLHGGGQEHRSIAAARHETVVKKNSLVGAARRIDLPSRFLTPGALPPEPRDEDRAGKAESGSFRRCIRNHFISPEGVWWIQSIMQTRRDYCPDHFHGKPEVCRWLEENTAPNHTGDRPHFHGGTTPRCGPTGPSIFIPSRRPKRSPGSPEDIRIWNLK
ncbi:hypothetical protein [Methanofollis aquaemaris]